MWSFIKLIGGFLVRFLLSAVWGLLALVLLLMLIGFFFSVKKPVLEPKSFLVINWSQGIVETKSAEVNWLGRLASELSLGDQGRVSVWDFYTSLEQAAKDPKIAGIFMIGRVTDSGMLAGQLHEAREAILAFKGSGKPVFAFLEKGSMRDYYMLSAADKVWMQPEGYIVFSGIALESPFFAEAMEKYGLELQVARSGKFKSTFEIFTEKSFSPGWAMENKALLEDVWGWMLKDMTVSRSVDYGLWLDLAQNTPLLSDQLAFQRGLVDERLYFDEVLNRLIEAGAEDKELKTFAQIDLFSYAQLVVDAQDATPKESPTIAIVYLDGEIVDGKGSLDKVGGERLSKVLRAARKNEKINGVVLRINSPGGSALASEVIAREVRLCAKKKPLVVSFGGVAASGGYWVAAEAPLIVADPLTITGSIGVVSALPNVQKLAADHGVTFDAIKIGDHAGFMQTFFRPRSPQEVAFLEAFGEETYQHFLSLVVAGRGLSKEHVADIAQGRIWSGVRAQKVGLVNTLGSLKTAVDLVAQKLGTEAYQVRHMGPDYTLAEHLNAYSNQWWPLLKSLTYVRAISTFSERPHALIDSRLDLGSLVF